MKKHRLITAAIVLLASAAVAVPALAQRRAPQFPAARGVGPRMGGGFGPQFTLEQQEQIQKIHERHNDERTELANRLRVMALEMQEIAGSDEPDFKAIEKKMEDMAAVRLDMAKIRLRIHQEIRPLLDDDQRTLFDRGFGHRLGRGGLGGDWHPGGRGGMRGHCRAGRAGAMNRGPARGQRPMRGGMGTGMGPAAAAGTCPWIAADVEELE